MKIVLAGGSGFLGQYLVHELAADGHECIVMSRHPERHRAFLLERGVRLVAADVYDPATLDRHLDGADAVISMAGILNEQGFSGKGFHRVHVELPGLLADACERAGTRRLVQVSALNAGKGSSHYLVSKGQAEAMLLARDSLDVTIFQPSVIFGRGDSFFNRFASLLKLAPVMPLACANSKMQPVHAGDVAAAVASSMLEPATIGRTYELGGPAIYTLKELVQFTARTLGLRRLIFGLPNVLARAQGLVLGLVPGKPFSMDNYRSLQIDNVTGNNGLRHFGIVPAAIESIVPGYLGQSRRQQRLKSMRRMARRG